MIPNNDFGAALRNYLSKTGRSQKWLAEKLNRSTAVINRYLKTKEPFVDTKTKILKALEITEEDLFGVEKVQVEEMVPKKLYDNQQRQIDMLNDKLMAYVLKENEQMKAERVRVTP